MRLFYPVSSLFLRVSQYIVVENNVSTFLGNYENLLENLGYVFPDSGR